MVQTQLFDNFWKWCSNVSTLDNGNTVTVEGEKLLISHSGKTSPYRIAKAKAAEYFTLVSAGKTCPSSFFKGTVRTYRNIMERQAMGKTDINWGREFGIPDNPPSQPFPTDMGVHWSNVVNHVQVASSQSIFPHAPPIIFLDQPEGSPPFDERDITRFATDYLGRYFPGNDCDTGCSLRVRSGRRIEIYQPRIERCAHELGVRASDLEVVVVVHELFHAVLHLGCAKLELENSRLGYEQINRFLSHRLDAWKTFGQGCCPSRVLELHAQLGTFHILASTEGPKTAFLELMKRQPDEYHVGDGLLVTKPASLWSWSCWARSKNLPDSGGIKTAKGMEDYLLRGVSSKDPDSWEHICVIGTTAF